METIQLQEKIDEVKGTMANNIEKMMKRSEHINLMMDKTDSLVDESTRFENSSKKLKQNMCLVHANKIALSITGLIIVIILIFLTIRWGSR